MKLLHSCLLSDNVLCKTTVVTASWWYVEGTLQLLQQEVSAYEVCPWPKKVARVGHNPFSCLSHQFLDPKFQYDSISKTSIWSEDNKYYSYIYKHDTL